MFFQIPKKQISRHGGKAPSKASKSKKGTPSEEADAEADVAEELEADVAEEQPKKRQKRGKAVAVGQKPVKQEDGVGKVTPSTSRKTLDSEGGVPAAINILTFNLEQFWKKFFFVDRFWKGVQQQAETERFNGQSGRICCGQ